MKAIWLVGLLLWAGLGGAVLSGAPLRLHEELQVKPLIDGPVWLSDLKNRTKLRGQMVQTFSKHLASKPELRDLDQVQKLVLAEALLYWDPSAHPSFIDSGKPSVHVEYQETRAFTNEDWTLVAQTFWSSHHSEIERIVGLVWQAQEDLKSLETYAARFEAATSLLEGYGQLNQLNPLSPTWTKEPVARQMATIRLALHSDAQKLDQAASVKQLLEQEQLISFRQTTLQADLSASSRPPSSTDLSGIMAQADWVKKQLNFLVGMAEWNLLYQRKLSDNVLELNPPPGILNDETQGSLVPTEEEGVLTEAQLSRLAQETLKMIQVISFDQLEAWSAWQAALRRLSISRKLAKAERPYIEELDPLVSRIYEDRSPLKITTDRSNNELIVAIQIGSETIEYWFESEWSGDSSTDSLLESELSGDSSTDTLLESGLSGDSSTESLATAKRWVRLDSVSQRRVQLVTSDMSVTQLSTGLVLHRSFERPKPSYEATAYVQLVDLMIPALESEAIKLHEKFVGQGYRWDKKLNMKLAWVQGGCFQMGCEGKDCPSNAQPKHEVCLDSFLMGLHEVTQELWTQVMGNNPSKFQDGPRYPVDSVSFDQAQQFLGQLERQGFHYRLPTEAEWEYACRAGKGNYGGTVSGRITHNQANYEYTQGRDRWGQTSPVGKFRPNAFGLYDLSGNVAEWVADQYAFDSYKNSETHNPVNRVGAANLLRGGSWLGGPENLSCHKRSVSVAAYANFTAGLRLVRVP